MWRNDDPREAFPEDACVLVVVCIPSPTQPGREYVGRAEVDTRGYGYIGPMERVQWDVAFSAGAIDLDIEDLDPDAGWPSHWYWCPLPPEGPRMRKLSTDLAWKAVRLHLLSVLFVRDTGNYWDPTARTLANEARGLHEASKMAEERGH